MEVCRLCLGLDLQIGYTFSPLEGTYKEMVQVLLPELNLKLTKDPVICGTCLDNLQKLHHFKMTCLKIESKLTDFCESHEITSSNQISLHSVLELDLSDMDADTVKSEVFGDESVRTPMKSAKDSEVVDAGLKQEEIYIKSELGTEPETELGISDKAIRNLHGVLDFDLSKMDTDSEMAKVKSEVFEGESLGTTMNYASGLEIIGDAEINQEEMDGKSVGAQSEPGTSHDLITTYTRTSDRGKWTQQQLSDAVQAVADKLMGINEAARKFNIPSRTLRRRIQKGMTRKFRMGPGPILGIENERKLAAHLKKLQSRGFTATKEYVRVLAYNFAVKMNIKHNFTNGKAGYDWLKSFLKRNMDLCVRNSTARVSGLNKLVVENYSQLLQSVMDKNQLLDKPGHIFNMDKTCLQLNNNPGFVLAEKESKSVISVPSEENGEIITVIACCNAEGSFLPPACVFKGTNKKAEFEDGMPPGAVVYMSEESAYVNADIIMEWLKNHFIPRKPQGKVLLIVDGHTSHYNVDTLEYAEDNNVIIMSLPSCSNQYVQPLDRTVFKSLKAAYYNACQAWMKANPSRQINRLQFGKLLNESWSKAATGKNAISSFKFTGIYPYDENAVPDYDLPEETATDALDPNQKDNNLRKSNSPIAKEISENPLPGPSR